MWKGRVEVWKVGWEEGNARRSVETCVIEVELTVQAVTSDLYVLAENRWKRYFNVNLDM